MKTKKIITWVALALMGGCVNFGLLDEMVLLDAGGGEAAGDADGDSDSDGDSDGDGDGPGRPQPDPDDNSPPVILSGMCGLFETNVENVCVAVGPASASFRFVTDEPAVVSLDGGTAGESGVLSVDWDDDHHLGVLLETQGDHQINIGFEDINGNKDQVDLTVTTLGGPAISVTEVYADPAGGEPAQEFVEIANFGSVDVDLSGWMIDDNGDANGDLIPQGTVLSPGGVAVLVSSEYDSSSSEDPQVASGALVIALDASIGSSGLKNSDAETVQLWDGAGTLVSEYLGQVGNPKEGKSARRLSAELPDDDELAFGLDPQSPSTPGTTAHF